VSSVGQVAEAVGWIARLSYEILHKNQKERIDEAYAKAAKDVGRFKQCLLEKRTDLAALMLDGLMFGIQADVSPSERLQLEQFKLGEHFDAYDLLGLYQRARGAEFSREVCEIVQTTPKE
jgi:hypothetical protein